TVNNSVDMSVLAGLSLFAAPILAAGIMSPFNDPANISYGTDNLAPQQQRNNEAAKRERADGGYGLPVHASERGEACAARSEDGCDPAPLISMLADFGVDA